MGALLAFESAREIRREYGLSPQHLFVAGRRAPTIPLPRKSIHDLPKQKFIEELREMNGTVPEVLEHTELIELLLPMLQADFAICETYEYKNDEPLNCGITVFGGLVDHFVSREHLEHWHRETLVVLSANAAGRSFLSAFFTGGSVGADVPGNAKNGKYRRAGSV